MNVTLKDIAQVVGVSSTAVSRALNNQSDIGIELKEKIKKVAFEMGYKPNAIAKRLKSQRSYTVGVFLLTRYKVHNDDNFGYRFFDGIFEEMNKRGYDFIVFSVDSQDFINKNYMELCTERQVEGAIFIGLGMHDKNIENISKSNIPIALIDSYVNGENISSVSTDNTKSVQQGMDYLWKLGHRKIAIIKGHEEAFVSKIRFQAYKDYLLEKGMYFEEYSFNGDFTIESGYNAAKAVDKLIEKPSAIFCESDTMAIGAIRAFKELGYMIPNDISIIGFDDIKIGKFIVPALTTLAQDPIMIGKTAAKLVIDQIEGKGTSMNIALEPKLIERESCSQVIN